MASKRLNKDDRQRIQVVCSHAQADILTKAADKAGSPDRSMWILAHALRAAGADHQDGAPVVIAGPVADRLRAEAKRQDVDPSQLLDLIVQGMH